MQPPRSKPRRRLTRPRLTEARIGKWLVAQHRRTGRWASKDSGLVVGAPGETWSAIDHCLRCGLRGLAGGSSLARLRATAGLGRNQHTLPLLQVEGILLWAVAEHESSGKWPTLRSGRVAAAPEETWLAIDGCLRRGCRGLPGGATLAGIIRLYRDILSRAHWGGPLADGQKPAETPEQVVARLVAGGFLKEPEIMKIIRERQREFLRECGVVA